MLPILTATFSTHPSKPLGMLSAHSHEMQRLPTSPSDEMPNKPVMTSTHIGSQVMTPGVSTYDTSITNVPKDIDNSKVVRSNFLVRFLRHVYNPIGFSKGYNAILWFITCGALLGFSLAKLPAIDLHGGICNPDSSVSAAPGECYHYKTSNFYGVGIVLHLATILPAGILAVVQFIPVIRHKLVMVHRVNGYIVLLLTLASMVGALMIMPVSFGGGVEIRAGVVFLTVIFVGALILAYINVKKLQIEEHRAWMIRAWAYAGSIITLRLIQIIAALVMSMENAEPYYRTMPCSKVAYIVGATSGANLNDGLQTLIRLYPDCVSQTAGSAPTILGDAYTIVRARLTGAKSAAEAAAVLNLTFGMALWLAVGIHILLAELYLHLTPAEGERIRQYSYKRQLEAGMRNPGRAGLTSDRFGDAKQWVPEK